MAPNSQREYRPGSRSKRFRDIRKGNYVEERRAWVNTALGQLVLMIYPVNPEVEKKEPGPTVKILIPRPRGPAVTWDLTYLTGEEIAKLKEFFRLAFEAAEPIISERDRMAQDALTEGDDSFSRIYRQVPQLVVRARSQPAHGEGIHNGSEDVSPGDDDGGSDVDSSGGIRQPSSELADADETERGSEDDNPQVD